MPPLSARLTSRVRRLLPTIEGGVAAGLSSRAINDAIRLAEGTGIRRQVLLDVIREIKGIESAGEQLQFVRLDRSPDPGRTPNAITPIRRRFGSTIRVDGFLTGTGEAVTRFVQVTHDDVLTRGQLEDAAASFFEGEELGDSASGVELQRLLLIRQVKRA